MIRKGFSYFRRSLESQRRQFLYHLDSERFQTLQAFYYPMLVFAGFYMYQVADEPTKSALHTLGDGVYEGWILLHLFCPTMSLIGRRLYTYSARVEAGHPNPAYGAAWMMFWGDFGVLSAIWIYTFCLIEHYTVGQPPYTTFYFLMGIPGGTLFTWRSWRRIREIHKLEKRMQ